MIPLPTSHQGYRQHCNGKNTTWKRRISTTWCFLVYGPRNGGHAVIGVRDQKLPSGQMIRFGMLLAGGATGRVDKGWANIAALGPQQAMPERTLTNHWKRSCSWIALRTGDGHSIPFPPSGRCPRFAWILYRYFTQIECPGSGHREQIIGSGRDGAR